MKWGKLTLASFFATGLAWLFTASSTKADEKVSAKPPNPLADWPADSAGRSAYALAAVKDGRATFDYATIVTKAPGGLMARIPVFADALKIDGIRVVADMKTSELIAQELGVYHLTPLLIDQIFKQADTRVAPQNRAWWSGKGGDGTMGLTYRMVDHSRNVDSAIAKAGGMGALLDNAGKFWALVKEFWLEGTNKKTGLTWLQSAANYGWITLGKALLQGLGFAHGLNHSDYSQTLRYAGPAIEVSEDNGASWRSIAYSEALTDTALSPLLSYATLPSARHPGVALPLVA